MWDAMGFIIFAGIGFGYLVYVMIFGAEDENRRPK